MNAHSSSLGYVLVVLAVLQLSAFVGVRAAEPPRCALLFVGNSDNQGATHGTGTVVSMLHPKSAAEPMTLEESLYIVTAYHNLYRKNSADFTVIRRADGIAARPIVLGSNLYFDARIYYSTVNDLAILRVKDIARFRADFGNDVDPIDVFSVPAIAMADAPKGVQGISIGNPRVGDPKGVAFSPQNVVYSCTIAEYEVAKNRLDSAILPNLPQSDEVSNNQWLFVEAMSIAAGFSGGPVIMSEWGVRDEGGKEVLVQKFYLAGIVSGGSAQLRPGRFAWASRASVLREALVEFKAFVDADDAKKTLPLPVDNDRAPKGILKRFPLPPGRNWPTWPYDTLHAYTFDHQRFFKHRDFFADDPASKEVLYNRDAYELIFDGVTFVGDVFKDGAYLANATFTKCNFVNVPFENAILTGAVFHNCHASGSDLQKLVEASMSHGTALLKGPALVERMPIKAAADSEEDLGLKRFLLKSVDSRAVTEPRASARPVPAPAAAPSAPAPRSAPPAIGSPLTGYQQLMERERAQYRNILKGP